MPSFMKDDEALASIAQIGSAVDTPFRIFPSQVTGAPVAEWEGASGAAGLNDFLAQAASAGVNQLYISMVDFDDRLERERRKLTDMLTEPLAAEDGQTDEEKAGRRQDAVAQLVARADEIVARVGDLDGSAIAATVAWASEGILHRFAAASSRYLNAVSALEALQEEASEFVEAGPRWRITGDGRSGEDWEARRAREQAERQAQVEMYRLAAEQWPEAWAADPDFQQARNYPSRVAAATTLTPKLRDALASGLWEVTSIANEALRQAVEIFKERYLPGQEAELARRARELLAAGRKKGETAAAIGVNSSTLTRLLVQYPD